MLRAKVILGLTLTGFLIVLTELSFSTYALIETLRWMRNPVIPLIYVSPVDIYLPPSLLALATFMGAVALYAVIRGRARWTWYAAVLIPIAIFLVIYPPPLSLGQVGRASTLPWAPPVFWSLYGSGALSWGLQLAAYAAAALTAFGLALATRAGGRSWTPGALRLRAPGV